MAKQSVKVLVEAGKATPGPPLGPALGALGVNVGQVVSEINKKTAHLEGMTVPVIVTVDTKTKKFEIEVGLPPVSALIKKELGIEKGSKMACKEPVGDISLEKVIEIARGRIRSEEELEGMVKQVLGTCLSMGVTVEGRNPKEVQRDIEEGRIKVR